jgi:hypothetical protein
MWQSVVAEGDILDGRGPGGNWAPTTKNNTRNTNGYWLHWLAVKGCLSAPVDHPLDRITAERIKVYIQDMEQNTAPLTRFVYILDLLRFAQAAAPDRNWDWLKRIKTRLWARARPAREKTSKIRNSGDLFELGLNLMNEASAIFCRYNPLQPAAGRGAVSRRPHDRAPRGPARSPQEPHGHQDRTPPYP